VILLADGSLDYEEARPFTERVIHVDDNNRRKPA
jgi:hypothetical protein